MSFLQLSTDIKAQILGSFRITDVDTLQEHLCKISIRMCKTEWKECLRSIFPRPLLSFHFVDERERHDFKYLNVEVRSIQSLELDEEFWETRIFQDDRPDNWPNDFEITEARPQDMVAGNNPEIRLTPNMKRIKITNFVQEEADQSYGSFRISIDPSDPSIASISDSDLRIRDFIRDHVIGLGFDIVGIEKSLRLRVERSFNTILGEINAIPGGLALAWFEGFVKVKNGDTVQRIPLNRHNAPVKVISLIHAQKFISMKFKTFMNGETAFSLLGNLMKEMLQSRHPSLILRVDFSSDMKNATINLVDVTCREPDLGSMTSDSTEDEDNPEYIMFDSQNKSVVDEAYQ